MSKTDYQHQLFESQSLKPSLVDADIEYWPEFLTEQAATKLFTELLTQTDWQQEEITLFGKTHEIPRLSCWVADAGLEYSYSTMTMRPMPWTAALTDLKQSVELFVAERFNSVLLNFYRNGKDSNGWHSDDEPELGQNPVIASLSLGAVRDFKMRHRLNKQLTYSLALQHGSLLLMRGCTQACWQHHIPKRSKVDERINLTFRTIKNYKDD